MMGIKTARMAIGTTMAAVNFPGVIPDDAGGVRVGVAEIVAGVVTGVCVGNEVGMKRDVEVVDMGAVSVNNPKPESALESANEPPEV